MKAQLRDLQYDILIITLVSLLLAFEVQRLLTRVNITNRFKLLLRQMDEASKGNFSRYLQTSGRNEVNDLLEAFNGSLRSVNDAYDDLATKAGSTRATLSSASRDALSALRSAFAFNRGRKAPPLGFRSASSVRMPLFLFVIAEELSRPFFPVYVSDLYVPIGGLSREMVIGLPITAFMLVVAVVTPISGYLFQRFGGRRLFLYGLVPNAIGFVMTALADDVHDLIVWRMVSAIGYGVIFIACQGYILDNTEKRHRSWGMAIFVGAIVAADICGPAIGGILAEQTGFRGTFLVSAGLVVVSGGFVYRFLAEREKERRERLQLRLRLADVKLLGLNPSFLAVVFLIAIPAKMILTSFVFFLVPLYLNLLGIGEAAAGRFLMVYGIVALLATPQAARLADRWERHLSFIVLGGLLSGGGVTLLLQYQGSWAVLAAIALLGLGQSLVMSSQIPAVLRLSEDECEQLGQATVVGVFRLFERLGAAAGPLVAAVLIERYDYPTSAAFIGGIVLLGAALLGVFALLRPALWRRRAEHREQG